MSHRTGCQRCGNVWDYSGSKEPGQYQYTTCPECGTTVKVGNRIEEAVTDGGGLSREERLELEDAGYVVTHPDHEDVLRIAVEDWSNVIARVIGLKDDLGDEDGMDVTMDQFAADGSTIELIVKGEVVVRLVHMEENDA